MGHITSMAVLPAGALDGSKPVGICHTFEKVFIDAVQTVNDFNPS